MEYRPTAPGARAAQRRLCVVVLLANARRAAPHVVGRGPTAPTAQHIGSGGFESSPSNRSNPEARVSCAYRTMENRLTALGACATSAADFARGCGAGQLATRSSPRRRPRLACIDGATGRRQGPRKIVFTAFESHDARTARISHFGASVDDARSTHCARRGLGLVVLWGNSRRAPPHAVGRGSAAPTARPVNGGNSKGYRLRVRLPWHASHARIAPWSTGRRPAEHAPRAPRGLGAWLWCGRSRRGALVSTPSANARPHRLRDQSAVGAPKGHRSSVRLPWRASRVRIALWSIGRRRAEHAPRGLRTWRVVVVRANLLRACPHAVDRCSTAPTARPVGSGGFERSSPTRSNPMTREQRAYRTMEHRSTTCGARTARAADLAWLYCGPTRGVLLLTPSAEARPHRQRDQSSAAKALKIYLSRVRLPWRASRARIAPWSIG